MKKIILIVCAIMLISNSVCFAQTYTIKDGQESVADADKILLYSSSTQLEITVNDLVWEKVDYQNQIKDIQIDIDAIDSELDEIKTDTQIEG